MSLIKGLHHISMKTCKEDEYRCARTFYVDLLGLSIVKESDVCLLLDTGSGIVEIFRNGDQPLPQGNLRHFAFAVDDVVACAKLVEQAGYEVFVQPKAVNIGGDESFPAEVAFCRGPLGEQIEFFCQHWKCE